MLLKQIQKEKINVHLHHYSFLIAVTLFALTIRIAAALYLGNQVVVLPGTADQVSYHALALRVLEGQGFTFDKAWWPATQAGEPTAHWSFLYVFYLVGVYALFQPDPLVARLIQAVVVGVLQLLLTYAICQHWLGKPAARIAAVLNAGYLYFVYYSATLMTESFYITAILAVVYFAILLTGQKVTPNPSQSEFIRRGVYYTIMLGISIGAAVLLRQLFLFLVPFIFFWIWWAGKGNRKFPFSRVVFIAMIVLIVMIVPFTLYNYTRFDRLVLLNTNSGYAFYWANHPIHGTNFITAREMDDYQSLIPKELLGLDEAALDQELLKLGFKFVVDDPVRYLRLSLSRIPVYFNFWPLQESGWISNITRVASFGLFLPFFLFGIGIWFKNKISKGLGSVIRSPGSLLLILASVYTAIHVLTWALVRYRLPVDAMLIPFAALAIAKLFRLLKFDKWLGRFQDDGI